MRVAVEAVGRDDAEEAEAARVAEAEGAAGGQVEDDVLVRLGRSGAVGERQPAAHPEVDDEGPGRRGGGLQMDQEVLAAAADPGDGSAPQPRQATHGDRLA